jgi:gliding motility-associated-like protein
VQVALDLTIADATADMEIAFDPARQNSLNFFYDRSSAAPGSIVDLAWTVNGVAAGATDTISHLMTNAGTYTVCLRVTSDAGCTDTLCRSVEVLPHGGIAPNVFTPNGDASNPTLHFDWLQPSQLNHLQVFNRWGQIVYDQTGYRNDWDGGGLPEGVYYYVLRLNAQEVITSYVHLLR